MVDNVEGTFKINNLINDTSNAYIHLAQTKLTCIVDSGCSAHYIKSEDAIYYPNKTEQSHIHVQLPNGANMPSNSTVSLEIPQVSHKGAKARVFLDLATGNLLSVGQLCDNGYQVVFSITNVALTNK